MKLGSMAFSDVVVLQTLERLISQHGPDKVSQSMIADESGAALITVKRSLKRLMLTGCIVGEFTPGVGYSYRIADGRETSLRN